MKKYIDFSSIKNKNILFLQGPVGNFFNEIDKKLNPYNNTYQIIFNKGDDVFSNIKNKIYFTDKFKYFDNFINLIYMDLHIDIVFLIGDCRILHDKAIKISKQYDIEVYVFEEGYLRPNFITMEKGGVNFNSRNFPKDIKIYKKMSFDNHYSQNIHSQNFGNFKNLNFKALFLSLKYYFYMNFDKQYFKNYKHHRNKNMLKEAKSFIKNGYKRFKYKKIDSKNIDNYIDNEKFFFMPLQLDNDMQIRKHSKYKNMFEFIEEVLISFANNANKEYKIIIKQHPLGLGNIDYEDFINDLVSKLNLHNRVLFIRTGDLGKILKNSVGVVVINSTVGLSSLYHLKPLKVMGKANYDIEGITHKNTTLNDFWDLKFSSDIEGIENFLNYLYFSTQYYGSFYIKNSIEIKV